TSVQLYLDSFPTRRSSDLIVGGTKMNGIKRSHMPLYIIASFLFGLKTYIIYRFFFTIELANFMQEFILLINPFIAAFLFFALSRSEEHTSELQSRFDLVCR